MIFGDRSTSPFLKLIIYFPVKWKEVNLPLYRDIIEKPSKLQIMIKRQIKDISIQKGNCI